MRLDLLPFELTAVRLEPSAEVPPWSRESRILSLFRGSEELSIICESHLVPKNVTAEGGWCAFKLAGKQPFTLTGVLESILKPLAEAEVSILALSSYDTDYVLIKKTALEEAEAALRERFELRYARTGLPLSRRVETRRLNLRRFQLTDVKEVFDYASSEENTRFLSWATHKSEEDSLRFLRMEEESALLGEQYNWAILDKASGRLIGSAGLTRLDADRRSAELGYVLHREFWGRGYATEVAGALLRFGFEEAGFERVHAYCFRGNDASRRVLEKLGMRYIGVEGVDTLRHRDPVPSHHFEIFEEEYHLALAKRLEHE
jgi:ribosomal-protein-alanine N-acetyltransferase